MLQLSGYMPLAAQKNNDSIPPFGERECCSCPGTCPRRPKNKNDSIPPFGGGMLQLSGYVPPAACVFSATPGFPGRSIAHSTWDLA